MPHLIVNCSKSALENQSKMELMQSLNHAALSTDLFKPETIKVRIEEFDHYLNGGKTEDFVHVFAHIMEGRNSDQKASLTDNIIGELKRIFPEIDYLSVNVIDMDKTTYRKNN